MGSYQIEFAKSVRKELLRLQPQMAKRIDAAILNLAENPFPQGSRKMAGDEDSHRIRVGDFRVIYEVRESVLVVLILQVGHRKDIYR
jgi:mRNA interferase RelE/StbE